MAPLLVYGIPLGSSMGLVAAMERLGQPYHLCRVDMLAEMKNSAFARINRRLETPVLITGDGRTLTETIAIALWLAARDGERRISFDLRTPESDHMHQLMAFINTGFTAAFSPLWAALEMEQSDPTVLSTLRDYGRKRVIERHDRLEALLGDTAFLVGTNPTLADYVLIGVARWLEFHAVAEASRWPRLAALRQRIETTPAVQFATAVENGENPTGSGVFLGHVPLSEVIERFGNKA
jgi:glutathione S-transferase